MLESLRTLVDVIFIPGVLALIGMILFKYTGITMEQRHADALTGALEAGADLVLNRVAEGQIEMTPKQMRQEVVKHAEIHTPDAVAHFEKTPEQLANMAEARLASRALLTREDLIPEVAVLK